jgi:hypothetical protein
VRGVDWREPNDPFFFGVPMADRNGIDDGSAACVFDLWLEDHASGIERPLVEYLQRFPGSERTIAREYLALAEERERGKEALPEVHPEPEAKAGDLPYVLSGNSEREGRVSSTWPWTNDSTGRWR